MNILGEQYDNLLSKEKHLKSVINSFEVILDSAQESPLAEAGVKRFKNELSESLAVRLEYLNMIEHVLTSAYENGSLDDGFYDQFKTEKKQVESLLVDEG